MIGKIFTLLNLDDTVLESFVIKYHEQDYIKSITFNDGTNIVGYYVDKVSGNGAGWFTLIGNMYKITCSSKKYNDNQKRR